MCKAVDLRFPNTYFLPSDSYLAKQHKSTSWVGAKGKNYASHMTGKSQNLCDGMPPGDKIRLPTTQSMTTRE